MGGGTSTGWVNTSGFKSVYDARADPDLDTARGILKAECRDDALNLLSQYEDSDVEVSLNVDHAGEYEITIQEQLVEGDDFFTRMANYLHGHRETFEGDIEPWYSNFGQNEVLE